MGRLIFYFASQAYYDEKRGTNGAFPLKGVKEYGDMVHKYNIPITWLTNAKGCEIAKDLFNEFHEKYGDECILYGLPYQGGDTSKKRDYVLKMDEKSIEDYIVSELNGMKRYIPWVKTDHIGFFYRTLPAVRVMEKLGIKSCYGHCWEMIATDGVTDNGTPWGFYYMDSKTSWKRPKQREDFKRGIIANEWLQHDLNKSWNYFGSCSVFSWDPNDVERAKICDGREIEYWKKGFREYYRNLEWNEFIPFVFHQEAHEQETTPGGWEVYPPETIQNTYEMTDEFLKFITSGEFPKMEILTLPEAIEEYRIKYENTNPTYMLFKDIEINTPLWKENWKKIWEKYQSIKTEEEEDGETFDVEKDYRSFSYFGFPYGWQGMVQKPPEEYFPDSFVYYDTQVELFFHRGNSIPIKIWNYLKEIDQDPNNLFFNQYLFKEDLPETDVIFKNKNQIPDKIIIKSSKSMPYGFCIWLNEIKDKEIVLKLEVKLDNNANIIEKKQIGSDLVFFRIDINKGNTLITIEEN